MRAQRFAAILSFGCFVPSALAGLVASDGTRLGFWDYDLGLTILFPAVVLALIGSLAGAVWIVSALRRNDSRGWRYGALGLAGSLVVAFIPLNQLRLYLISPPIHDITTDVEYPPPFIALLPLRAGATNGPEYDGMKLIDYGGRKTHVAAAQKKAYPDIRGAGVLEKPAVLFWHAFATAKRMSGWNIAAFDEKTGMIEASATSQWFGLTSDIAIRVKPAGSIGARLDIRSKSRIGENDMGMNAQIVRDYLKALR
ncbi:MAG TPA: DUF1499 domain-containing protein [Rhizomicrobium sp.]|nr:DUF1499 domain-containing protein [Rhizomicrobium sp.]